MALMQLVEAAVVPAEKTEEPAKGAKAPRKSRKKAESGDDAAAEAAAPKRRKKAAA
jgi:hypothetical protein